MRDWFTARIRPTFAKLLAPYAGKRVSYLEIGVCRGISMEWMARNILTHIEAKAVGIDFWDLDPHPIRIGAAPLWEAEARRRLAPFSQVRIIKDFSRHALAMLQKTHAEAFDIVYIDGDHSYDGTLADSRLAWPLAKTGAMIIWDDVNMNKEWDKHKRPAVREAVAAFLAEYHGHYRTVIGLGRARQAWVVKTA